LAKRTGAILTVSVELPNNSPLLRVVIWSAFHARRTKQSTFIVCEQRVEIENFTGMNCYRKRKLLISAKKALEPTTRHTSLGAPFPFLLSHRLQRTQSFICDYFNKTVQNRSPCLRDPPNMLLKLQMQPETALETTSKMKRLNLVIISCIFNDSSLF
jgi:hypothetical protein